MMYRAYQSYAQQEAAEREAAATLGQARRRVALAFRQSVRLGTPSAARYAHRDPGLQHLGVNQETLFNIRAWHVNDYGDDPDCKPEVGGQLHSGKIKMQAQFSTVEGPVGPQTYMDSGGEGKGANDKGEAARLQIKLKAAQDARWKLDYRTGPAWDWAAHKTPVHPPERPSSRRMQKGPSQEPNSEQLVLHNPPPTTHIPSPYKVPRPIPYPPPTPSPELVSDMNPKPAPKVPSPAWAPPTTHGPLHPSLYSWKKLYAQAGNPRHDGTKVAHTYPPSGVPAILPPAMPGLVGPTAHPSLAKRGSKAQPGSPTRPSTSSPPELPAWEAQAGLSLGGEGEVLHLDGIESLAAMEEIRQQELRTLLNDVKRNSQGSAARARVLEYQAEALLRPQTVHVPSIPLGHHVRFGIKKQARPEAGQFKEYRRLLRDPTMVLGSVTEPQPPPLLASPGRETRPSWDELYVSPLVDIPYEAYPVIPYDQRPVSPARRSIEEPHPPPPRPLQPPPNTTLNSRILRGQGKHKKDIVVKCGRC